jgi:hypothetical protein
MAQNNWNTIKHQERKGKAKSDHFVAKGLCFLKPLNIPSQMTDYLKTSLLRNSNESKEK